MNRLESRQGKRLSDDKVYYQGNVTVNGAGSLGGIYVLAGRYQSTFLLDNIAVY